MADAAEYLGQPGLRRALAGARERLRTLGKLGGSFELDALTPEEASALSGLLQSLRRARRPRPDRPFRVSLRDLDLALRRTRFRIGLVDALELIGPPVESAPAQRAGERARRDAAWERMLAHPLCLRDPIVRAWVVRLRERGLLRRMCADEGFELLAAALDIGARLPADPPVERTRLASLRVEGDPHALDDDRPLARLLTAQLAHRASEPASSSRGDRRLLWQRFGVLLDSASADVLTLNLEPVGDGPLARALHLMAGQHFRITLGQLQRQPLHFPRAIDMFACENPTVLLAAESRLGCACPPLICVGGWPSAAACALLARLTADGATVRYHGDFDRKGVEIHALLERRYSVLPWRYDEPSYRHAVARHEPRTRALRGEATAREQETRLLAAMRELGRELHEEVLLDELVADLVGARRLIDRDEARRDADAVTATPVSQAA